MKRKDIQRKYFIYKQAAWDQSYLKPFRRFHKMTFYGRGCMIKRIICKTTTVDSSNAPFPDKPRFSGSKTKKDTLMKIATLV